MASTGPALRVAINQGTRPTGARPPRSNGSWESVRTAALAADRVRRPDVLSATDGPVIRIARWFPFRTPDLCHSDPVIPILHFRWHRGVAPSSEKRFACLDGRRSPDAIPLSIAWIASREI